MTIMTTAELRTSIVAELDQMSLMRLLLMFLCIGMTWMLTACGTVTEELLVPLAEYNANKSVNSAKPSSSSKQDVKEREKLIQAGKCPTCKGMGKTPDGRYTCSACNGTGKYNG